jgi:hypothetical protein
VDSEWLNKSPKEKGTYYYFKGKQWNSIDHIFYAEGLNLQKNTSKTFRYESGSYAVVKPAKRYLGDKQNPQGCEIIPEIDVVNGRQGNACPFGASDHFGIRADFVWRE